jgi:hypothetical protein
MFRINGVEENETYTSILRPINIFVYFNMLHPVVCHSKEYICNRQHNIRV